MRLGGNGRGEASPPRGAEGKELTTHPPLCFLRDRFLLVWGFMTLSIDIVNTIVMPIG